MILYPEHLFTVPGEPQGKGRPRFMRSGHTYTPSKTVACESLVRACYYKAAEEHNWLPFQVEPLQVYIVAVFSVPKSATKKNRGLMLLDRLKPCKKPDADNIGKVVCDALNGHAYRDDAQITALSIVKKFGPEPMIKVLIAKDNDILPEGEPT